MAVGDKVTVDKNRAGLESDLARYCELALELGADHAAVIPTGKVHVDERVRAKCRYPRCYAYGLSAHCPPHAAAPEEMRALVGKYEQAVLFSRRHPVELVMRERTDADRMAGFRLIYDIVGKLEAAAFYDGHYLAFGLGAGSCKSTFCGNHKTCVALKGGPCRFGGQARPSMEAVGMDVYRMVAEAGWDIYMTGSGADPEKIPFVMLTGIVMVQ